MKNLPIDIWLQIGEDTPNDADFDDLENVTWCGEKIEDNDVHYVNLDFIVNLMKDKYGAISLADCIVEDIKKNIGKK